MNNNENNKTIERTGRVIATGFIMATFKTAICGIICNKRKNSNSLNNFELLWMLKKVKSYHHILK